MALTYSNNFKLSYACNCKLTLASGLELTVAHYKIKQQGFNASSKNYYCKLHCDSEQLGNIQIQQLIGKLARLTITDLQLASDKISYYHGVITQTYSNSSSKHAAVIILESPLATLRFITRDQLWRHQPLSAILQALFNQAGLATQLNLQIIKNPIIHQIMQHKPQTHSQLLAELLTRYNLTLVINNIVQAAQIIIADMVDIADKVSNNAISTKRFHIPLPQSYFTYRVAYQAKITKLAKLTNLPAEPNCENQQHCGGHYHLSIANQSQDTTAAWFAGYYLGKQHGWLFPMPANTTVLIDYLENDHHQPIILGTPSMLHHKLSSDTQILWQAANLNGQQLKFTADKTAQQIELADASQQASIRMLHSTQKSSTNNKQQNFIAISNKQGAIDFATGNDSLITATKNLTLTSQQNTQFSSQQAIDIETKQQSIRLQAQQQIHSQAKQAINIRNQQQAINLCSKRRLNIQSNHASRINCQRFDIHSAKDFSLEAKQAVKFSSSDGAIKITCGKSSIEISSKQINIAAETIRFDAAIVECTAPQSQINEL